MNLRRKGENKSNVEHMQCAPTLVVLITIICMMLFATMCVCITRPTEIASLLNWVTGKGNSQKIEEPPIIINLANQEMSALEATADHDHNLYLVSKYDKTNHWQECSLCRTRINEEAHTFTDTWILGEESCKNGNKCVHTCSCGYSYESTIDHTPGDIKADAGSYRHYQVCSVCKGWIWQAVCKKEDGSIIGCANLGTCVTCGYKYSKSQHMNFSGVKNGTITCGKCGLYIGEVSNLNFSRSSNTLEVSLDFTIPDTGNFNNIKESSTITKTSPTSMHIVITKTFDNTETKIPVQITLGSFYVSSDDYVSLFQMNSSVSPDIDPPVIANIDQNDLASNNGWAIQKKITVTGTENFCSSVKLTMKDNEGNIYLNNAATIVTDNAWTYTFIPDIEVDEAGKEFTITATDNFENSSEQKFMVYKTDKKPPIMTSASETSKDWTKSKEFTFTAIDGGSGGVSISVNNANEYVSATKAGITYSRSYIFEGDIYGSRDVTVYFKDSLGNTTSETVKVYNIDNTAPTITGHEIINKEIVLTGNDINTTLNKEGSGIVGYRYIGSSRENETIVAVGSGLDSARNRKTNNI